MDKFGKLFRAHPIANHMTPIERWRQDLIHVRPLGIYAHDIDHYFHHRIKRLVRKDGTVGWDGAWYEVPYQLVGQRVHLVVDPHCKIGVEVESLEGVRLGAAYLLDKKSNCHRKRQRPKPIAITELHPTNKTSVVEIAYQDYQKKQIVKDDFFNNDNEEN